MDLRLLLAGGGGAEDSRPLYEPGHDPEIMRCVAGRGEPVLAVPERAGVCVSGEEIRAIGYEPVAVFRPGEDGAEIIPPGARVGGG